MKNTEKKDFGSLSNYLEYIEEYKETIEMSVLVKYSVEHQDDYTTYTLVDTYGNTYIVKETSIMNYTIQLDNYTIKNSDYETNYMALEEEDKVAANAYIFLSMINTKDYEHAYALLNDSFKANNFDNIEKFKNYVKENFFDYNIDTNNIELTTQSGYYVYKTTIKDSNSSAAETKELTIIMALGDGTDFEVSFNIE